MRATGLPEPLRLRLAHVWLQARFAECTCPRFGARFRQSYHALVETVPGRPGTPKQVVREGSTLRCAAGTHAGYLNIASICSRRHEWGLNTMPHPEFCLVLKGSEGGCVRRGSQRRVVCGLNTHGCKPVLRNALGLGLEHPLSKRSQDAPERLSKWSGGLHASSAA